MIVFPEAIEQAVIFEKSDAQSHFLRPGVNQYNRDNGLDFINGKAAFRQWLQNRFEKQLDYSVKLDLWGALKGRMAVRFEAEWRDTTGGRYRSYGVGVFQFNDDGFAEKRFASQEFMTM
jgi:nuclear transport factor 2 (NTF2) superfamily protein